MSNVLSIKKLAPQEQTNVWFCNSNSTVNGGWYILFNNGNGTIGLENLAALLGYRLSEEAIRLHAKNVTDTDYIYCQSFNNEGWSTDARHGMARLFATRLEIEKIFHLMMSKVKEFMQFLQVMEERGHAERI